MEALAIDFHPVRPVLPSYDKPEEVSKIMEKCMDRKTGTDEIFNSLILPYLRDIYEDLHSAVHKADLLVTHPLPLVGPIVAQRLSWEETYKEMAREREDWSDLDVTLADGLKDGEDSW